MSVVVCTKCAKGAAIHLRRGTRIAEFSCQCGGSLTIAGWTAGGWAPRSPDKARAMRTALAEGGYQWDGFAKAESFGTANF